MYRQLTAESSGAADAAAVWNLQMCALHILEAASHWKPFDALSAARFLYLKH